MADNPLFPSADNPSSGQQPDGFIVSPKKATVRTPDSAPAGSETDRQAAADLIRRKLDRIYADEPDAEQEIKEAETVKPRSKHQEFMHALATSGKSLAEIQTEWHHYYITLPNKEKHEVWQEFYESSATLSKYHKHVAQPKQIEKELLTAKGIELDNAKPRVLAVHPAPKKPNRSRGAIKKHLLEQVTGGGKLTAKHHLQSLLFGLGLGFVVILIFLFGFFNEVVIAPFIQPSRNASATPLILSTDSVAPSSTPEVIIPKINVEIPVVYTQASTNESDIENSLEDGVVHYPTTVMPGEKGNAAFFGHSSNNIFNKGKYKFAFVLLHTLVPGDTFYLTYNGKVYVYKVITKTIVDPSEVGVLGPVQGQTATATLITCDPPGTSLHRLVIVGQQISPDPAGNTESQSQSGNTVIGPTQLPGNGPTLWTRFTRWLSH